MKGIKFIERSKKDHECVFCHKVIPPMSTYIIFTSGRRLRYVNHFELKPGYPKKCCWDCYPKERIEFRKPNVNRGKR